VDLKEIKYQIRISEEIYDRIEQIRGDIWRDLGVFYLDKEDSKLKQNINKSIEGLDIASVYLDEFNVQLLLERLNLEEKNDPKKSS